MLLAVEYLEGRVFLKFGKIPKLKSLEPGTQCGILKEPQGESVRVVLL